MNEQITISALYDLNETIAADIFKDYLSVGSACKNR